MLFSFGKDRAEGYIPITYLIRGSELRPVTVAAEFAPNFTSSCLDQLGSNLGSVLWRTLHGLVAEIKERKAELIEFGSTRSCTEALTEDYIFFRDQIYEGTHLYIPKTRPWLIVIET
jgi:hypothetical protein